MNAFNRIIGTNIVSSTGRCFLVLSVCALMVPSGLWADEDWTIDVTLSGAGRFVSDDEGRFAERHRVSPEPSGGIEDLYIHHWIDSDRTLKVQGHAVFDEHDYALEVDFDAPDEAYVHAGYREFRIWDDASGGFFPQAGGVFLPLLGDEFELDRRRAWLHAGLRGKGIREIDLRYSHRERNGEKGSLVWGETNNTGALGPRSIVPSFWDIDESSDIVELELAHRVKGTKLRGRARYESFDTDNSRNIRRNPAEDGLDRFMTQQDAQDGDVLGANAASETRFKKGKVVLTTGYSFSRVKNDVAGSRIYGDRFGATFSPTFANRQFFEREVLGLAGQAKSYLHAGNVNFMLRPSRNLTMTTAMRFGQENRRNSAEFSEIFLDLFQTPPLVGVSLTAYSRTERRMFTTTFDMRYTGLRSLVLYANAEWEETDGNLFERLTEDASTSIERDTDVNRSAQRASIGATWYPTRPLSVTGRYRYARRKNDYDHVLDSTDNTLGGDRYPAFLLSDRIERNNLDLRATWRAAATLSFVTRYDLDLTTVDSRGGTLAEVESAKITSHAFSTAVSWNPLASIYLQADGTYVIAQTDTPADELSGTTGSLVPDFDNDYVTATLLGGWAVDDSTDLTARYYFYQADNYVDNSTVSQPYGADTREHGVRVQLSRRISDSTRLGAGYGFIQGTDDESGGNDDYQAHLVSATVELQF